MEKLSMCRICLVQNVRMCVVTNKSLQEMYEKLTGVPFVTEDRKPMLACSFCCTRLKQCCQLQRKCVEAEELLAQMLSEDYEQKPLTNRGHLELVGGFIITPIENISIVDDCQIGCDAIKEELPVVCEEQDDVALQPAHLSEELDPENLYNIHPDVKEHHSGSESEEEQLLVEIKIEEEEEEHELSESRRVRETEKTTASKKQTLKRKLEDTIPAKRKTKRGRKFINSLEDQRKAFLPYKNFFQNINNLPPTSNPVYAKIKSDLPRPVTEQGLLLSVKKNFKYFFDVANIKEVDSFRHKRGISKNKEELVSKAAVAKKPIKRKLEDTLPAKKTMRGLSDSKIIQTTEPSTSESVAKIKEPIATTFQSSFSQASNLIRHTRIKGVTKAFECDICYRSYSTKSCLKIHLRKHSGERPYKCDICLRSFHQKCTLTAHRRIHTGEKPYKCDVCQHSFGRKTDLVKHIWKHSDEKPFKCDVCQRSFSEKSYLALHFKVHSGEKPFKCDVCQRGYSCNSRLKRHFVTHTNVKPFKCDVCQTSFRDKSNFNKHCRKHTGEKSVKCDICQRYFRDKGCLKRHSLIHTGLKPFSCDICQCSFSAKSSLIVHNLRKHTAEKPTKCDVCQRNVSSESNLEVHFKQHSGEKPIN